MNNKDLKEITEDFKRTLMFMSDNGCKGFDCSDTSLEIVRSWGQEIPIQKKPEISRGEQAVQQNVRMQQAIPVQQNVSGNNSKVPARNMAVDNLDITARYAAIEKIRMELGNCLRCNLGKSRKNIVFGAGFPGAKLVFVGEAPGFEEDQQGTPFVGASGQLLSKMIQAMGLRREDVYIANVLKCRPPANRNPLPEEIVTCLSFLKRQLEVIRPEVICTLGGFATQALLDKPDGITRLRGIFHDYNGIKVMPVFHPAYLLRNAGKKREAWADLQKVMSVLRLQRRR